MRAQFWLLTLLFLSIAWAPSLGWASGTFGATDKPDAAAVTVEQAVVTWDSTTKLEELVRETRFDRASGPIGLLVPVPSRPEVFPVVEAPFEALRKAWPYAAPSAGSPSGVGPPGVEILAKQRIGSSTATILHATDAGALDAWLSANGLVCSAPRRSWIQHYVTLKFYFVALLSEGGDGGADPNLTTAAVRIRFSTPVPYFPYREPAFAAMRVPNRLLQVWTVMRDPIAPVVFRDKINHAPAQFERPWDVGARFDVASDAAKALLPGVTFPDSKLVVQVFRDRRTAHETYGDVLLVPATEKTAGAGVDDLEARKALAPALDETLLQIQHIPPASRTPSPSPSSCSASSSRGPHSSDAFALAMIACAFLLVRRRSLGVALLALGCTKAAPPPPDAGPPPTASTDEHEERVLAIMAGHVPDGGFYTPVPHSNRPFVVGPQINVAVSPARASKGTLPSDVDKVLATANPRLLACYKKSLADDPLALGRLRVDLEVDTSGRVQNAKFEKEGISDSLDTCAEQVVGKLRFAAGANARIAFNLGFRQVED